MGCSTAASGTCTSAQLRVGYSTPAHKACTSAQLRMGYVAHPLMKPAPVHSCAWSAAHPLVIPAPVHGCTSCSGWAGPARCIAAHEGACLASSSTATPVHALPPKKERSQRIWNGPCRSTLQQAHLPRGRPLPGRVQAPPPRGPGAPIQTVHGRQAYKVTNRHVHTARLKIRRSMAARPAK